MERSLPAPPSLPPTYRASSRYDDVWSRDSELCAYCAREVAYDERRCPQCKRALVCWRFRYDEPSSNLHILWVLLAGLAQLFLINAVGDVASGAGFRLAALHTFLAMVWFGLAAAVYFRQFWAYWTAIVLLLVLLFLWLVGALDLIESVLPTAENDVEAMLTGPFLDTLASGLRGLQIGAMGLALLWAIFLAGPDFQRDVFQVRAEVDRRLQDGSSLYTEGRRYAQQGKWATAILHWQRAAANEPYNLQYHLSLGKAYARLGFFERSLDLLESARALSRNGERQSKIDGMIAAIRKRESAEAGTIRSK